MTAAEMISAESWTKMLDNAVKLLPQCAGGLAVFVAFWLAGVVAVGHEGMPPIGVSTPPGPSPVKPAGDG